MAPAATRTTIVVVLLAAAAVAWPASLAQGPPHTSFGRAVTIGDPDLSPTLTDSSSPVVCYVDANGDGVYNLGDAPFVRFGANTCAGSPAGMLRLVSIADGPFGELVRASDSDGRGGVSSLAQQPTFRFADRNGNNQLDMGDMLYMSLRDPLSHRVHASDLRLTRDDDLEPGRQVHSTDRDVGSGVQSLGSVNVHLDFLDADGDGSHSGADRVYVNRDGISNRNVAFGDVRLSGFGANQAGSFVVPGDQDAVHSIRPFSAVSLCIVDADESAAWEAGEAVVVVSGAACGASLSPGASRLTTSQNASAGSRVLAADPEVGKPLVELSAGSSTLAYIDVDGSGSWSAADAMYLNIADTNALRVNAGDVRLTFSMSGRAGSLVAAGESDVGAVLRPLGSPQSHLQHVEVATGTSFLPSAGLYVNVDAGTDEGVEINDVRLSTLASDLQFGTRVGAASRDAVLRLATGPVSLCFVDDSGNGAYDGSEPVIAAAGSCPASIGTGVLRLSERGAYSAGSFVAPGQADSASRAIPLPSGSQLKYFDVNGDGRWDIGDTLYLDLVGTSSNTVATGDLRLSSYGTLAAGNHVRSSDTDAGFGLTTLGAPTSFVRFVEVGGITGFSHGDLLYVNVDQGGAETVEAGDVRLTDLGTPEQAPAPSDDGPIPPPPGSDHQPPPPLPDSSDDNATNGDDEAPPGSDDEADDDNETDPSGPRSRTPAPGFALLTVALVGLLSLLRRRP